MKSIGHFICYHDTRDLHVNGSVLMLEGERLACDGRQWQCFTHFYYIIGIGPSMFVNDSSARDSEWRLPFLLCSKSTLFHCSDTVVETF